MTIFARNECQIAARSCFECVEEDRQDRQCYLSARLLGLDGAYAVANVLTPKPHCIATTQTCVDQHIKPHALPCADGPTLLVGRYVILGPRGKTIGLQL